MMVELFAPSLNLATDINAISFLYQFLIQGFVRVHDFFCISDGDEQYEYEK